MVKTTATAGRLALGRLTHALCLDLLTTAKTPPTTQLQLAIRCGVALAAAHG